MARRRDIFVTPTDGDTPAPLTPGFIRSNGTVSSSQTPYSSSSDFPRSSTVERTPFSQEMLTRKPPSSFRRSGGPSSETIRTPGGKRVQTTRGSRGDYSIPSSGAQSSVGVNRTSVMSHLLTFFPFLHITPSNSPTLELQFRRTEQERSLFVYSLLLLNFQN